MTPLQNEEAARDYCAALTDGAGLTRLDRLVEMVVQENERQNLMSKSSEQAIWLRHMADSAQLLAHAPDNGSPWLDLGTGAGFPGLVIAAMRPDQDIALVESRKKRVDWLVHAAAELGLLRQGEEAEAARI